MVVLNKIYTKTGDNGTTALGSGERRPKYDLRIDAYGTVDETNAIVGMARLHTASVVPDIDAVLNRIQNDLYSISVRILPHRKPIKTWATSRSGSRMVRCQQLKKRLTPLNAELSPLRSFVLPGGSAASAHLHLARTVSRRAERLMVELADRESINQAGIRYMNRLSDYFFVASRYLNNKGEEDVLWVPGKNR
jgi:cob(I)alamin adenosyltransferase